MSAGNVNTPAALWAEQRLQIEGVWPPVLALLDLNFWSDPIACDRRPRPSERELVETWGWSKSRVHRFVSTYDEAWTNRGPRADHPRTSSGPVGPGTTPEVVAKRTSGGPDVDHERTSSGPALVDTRARSSLVSTSQDTQAEKDDPWQRLADAWREKHPGGPKLSPSKGQGQMLKARLSEHGEEVVRRVLWWAHHSQHSRAVFLRERGLDLTTLLRPSNFEVYAGFAAEEKPSTLASSGRPVPPSSLPRDTRTPEEIAAIRARRGA